MEELKTEMAVQGSHRSLLYRQLSNKHMARFSTIFVRMEASPKKVTFDGDSGSTKLGDVSKKEVVITLPVKSLKTISKGTQTDYRDSEAQTLPWRHDIRADKNLMEEFLALDSFSWERDFFLGMREVSLIERTRQKSAWENVIAKLRGKENSFKRKLLVGKTAEMEILFREKELDEIHTERMKLSKKLLNKKMKKSEDDLQKRLLRSYKARKSENDEKIDYWKRQLLREQRKMKLKREESSCKPKKRDIVCAHLDKTSELYAPKIRDGKNPARGHEVIDIQCRYLKRFHGLEILETYLPDFFEPERQKKFQIEKISKAKKKKICLKKFRCKTLKCKIMPSPEIEEKLQEPLCLKKPITETTLWPEAPKILRQLSDADEELYQASVLLKKIVKGRAIQIKKFLEKYSKKKTD